MRKKQGQFIDVPTDNLENPKQPSKHLNKVSNEVSRFKKPSSPKHALGSSRDIAFGPSPKGSRPARPLDSVKKTNFSTRTIESAVSTRTQCEKDRNNPKKDNFRDEYFDPTHKKPKTTKNADKKVNFFEYNNPLLVKNSKAYTDQTLPKGFIMTPTSKGNSMPTEVQTPKRNKPLGLGYHRASSKELGNRPSLLDNHITGRAKAKNDTNVLYMDNNGRFGGMSPKLGKINQNKVDYDSILKRYKIDNDSLKKDTKTRKSQAKYEGHGAAIRPKALSSNKP